jgi:hypothetical protein
VVSGRSCGTNPICLLFTWTYKIKDTNSPVLVTRCGPQSQKAAPVAHRLQGCSREQGDCNSKGMRTKRELACQVVLARWARAKQKGQRTSGAFSSGFAPARRSAQIVSRQYRRDCALGYASSSTDYARKNLQYAAVTAVSPGTKHPRGRREQGRSYSGPRTK